MWGPLRISLPPARLQRHVRSFERRQLDTAHFSLLLRSPHLGLDRSTLPNPGALSSECSVFHFPQTTSDRPILDPSHRPRTGSKSPPCRAFLARFIRPSTLVPATRPSGHLDLTRGVDSTVSKNWGRRARVIRGVLTHCAGATMGRYYSVEAMIQGELLYRFRLADPKNLHLDSR